MSAWLLLEFREEYGAFGDALHEASSNCGKEKVIAMADIIRYWVLLVLT
jgi:hypothetical protein